VAHAQPEMAPQQPLPQFVDRGVERGVKIWSTRLSANNRTVGPTVDRYSLTEFRLSKILLMEQFNVVVDGLTTVLAQSVKFSSDVSSIIWGNSLTSASHRHINA
jgi:hypothetical protein